MINYVDKYGRWHVKPVTETNPLPTNNGYIYSFYAKMVGFPVVITGECKDQLDIIDKTVLTRHPGINSPAISHDEYVGVAGMWTASAEDIVYFGEKNYFQFCDQPNFIPTPFRKLVINDVVAAYEDLANEENPRLATIKYPALMPIAFWHRTEQQYFYYRCAGRSPGIVRTLYFIIATIISILQKDKKSPMLGFKFLKFKQIGPTFIEKALIKLFDKFGDFKNVCRNYFPAGHPILERVETL